MSGLLHRTGGTAMPVAAAAGDDSVAALCQQGRWGIFPAVAAWVAWQDIQNHQVQDDD